MSTYDVFAICKLFVLAAALGTLGIPVNSGELISDFVFNAD